MLSSFQKAALLSVLLFGLVMLCAAGPRTVPAAVNMPGEYQVKAVFLYNLAKFVQWPPGWFADNVFRIGIYGEDPFGDIIDQTVAEEMLHARQVRVLRYSSPAELSTRPVEVLFISSSAVGDFSKIRKAVAGRPVLMVADTPGFLESGGMVNLVRNQRQIELRINRHAVARADLFISSKLLRLATVVE